VARAAALLADDERRSFARASPDVARRRVLGRAALRTVLAAYLERAPQELAFRHGAFGKPRLAEPVGLHFNLSRSGDRCLIAVARGGRVGVDVERLRSLRDLDAIAARAFAASELASIQELDERRKLHAFWACWTRKEAFVKAIGGGLSMPLDRFTVSVRDDESPAILTLDGDEPGAWRLTAMRPWPGYVAALATRPTDRSQPMVVRALTLALDQGQSALLAER
jgi:4'-phosphopantetheinyl transferase